jgi:hypothetical protein
MFLKTQVRNSIFNCEKCTSIFGMFDLKFNGSNRVKKSISSKESLKI